MLPELAVPTYQLTIPSTGKVITVRPFLVGEEKLLFMALEGDGNDIIATTKQIIKRCIIEGDTNLDNLAFFDIDYLFIALRAKSVGETIDVTFKCNIEKNGVPCDARFPVQIDIANCEVEYKEKINPLIVASNKIKVKMKYPNYSVMKGINTSNSLDTRIQLIAGSIDFIQDGDKLYKMPKDASKEELIKFIESMTQAVYKKFEEYIDNFPSFCVKVNTVCPKCKHKHELKYREFESFFV